MTKQKQLRIALTEQEGRKVNQFCSLIRSHATECVAFIDSLVKRFGEPEARGAHSRYNIPRPTRYVDIAAESCEAMYVKTFSKFLRLSQAGICQNFLDDCREKGWVSAEHLIKDTRLVYNNKRKSSQEEVKEEVVLEEPTVETVEEVQVVEEPTEEIVDNNNTPAPNPEQVSVNKEALMAALKWACQKEDAPHYILCKLLMECM